MTDLRRIQPPIHPIQEMLSGDSPTDDARAAASLAGSPTFKSGGGFASLKTPALSNALSKLSADAPARATMTSKLR